MITVTPDTRQREAQPEPLKLIQCRPLNWHRAVYNDPDTTGTERRVASVLLMYADNDDGSRCYPGVDLISKLAKMNRNNVIAALFSLEAKSYLFLVRHGSKRAKLHDEYQLTVTMKDESISRGTYTVTAPAMKVPVQEMKVPVREGESTSSGDESISRGTPTPLNYRPCVPPLKTEADSQEQDKVKSGTDTWDDVAAWEEFLSHAETSTWVRFVGLWDSLPLAEATTAADRDLRAQHFRGRDKKALEAAYMLEAINAKELVSG